MGVSHIVVKKGGIYSGRDVQILGGSHRPYRCLNGGIFREGGIDSARVTYIFKRGGGIFW